MIIKAYAKINLSLNVKEKRDDGYHDLETIMLPIDVHDSIEISVIPADVVCDDYVICDDFALGVSKYNLCHKAINECRKIWGFKEHFNISIHKNIFLQAGLGGGSADAAATILGIVKLLNIKTNINELISIAINLGSDVPWALLHEPCLVKRKGNILEPFTLSKSYYVLIVKPEQGLSTHAVFDEGDKVGFDPHGNIDKVKEDLCLGNFEELSKSMFNSLEKAAIKLLPEIETKKDELKKLGFSCVLMSGAGSSVFAITDDLQLAKKAYKTLYKKENNIVLTKTIANSFQVN